MSVLRYFCAVYLCRAAKMMRGRAAPRARWTGASMTSKDRRKQLDCVAHEPATVAPGASLDPTELAEEDTTPDVTRPRAIPIGRPMDVEEYRRLKEAARTRPAPPAPSAQEDPAASRPD